MPVDKRVQIGKPSDSDQAKLDLGHAVNENCDLKEVNNQSNESSLTTVAPLDAAPKVENQTRSDKTDANRITDSDLGEIPDTTTGSDLVDDEEIEEDKPQSVEHSTSTDKRSEREGYR